MQMPNFNPDLLTVARDLRSISQESLAQKLKISQGHLSKIENGLIPPDDAILSKLSKHLAFPKAFFLQSDRVYGAPMSAHSAQFRKPKSVTPKTVGQITAELNLIRLNVCKLLKSIDLTSTLKLPRYDIEDGDISPPEIAHLVRQTWMLPKGPMKNLTECMEHSGIVIYWSDLAFADVDGVTFNTPDAPPIVMLNKNRPADRMRFSLAHELGHIVMHRQPRPQTMEDEANQFASALLMPDKDFVSSCPRRLDLSGLVTLKMKWKVSMAAALYRAKELDLISYNQSTYLWKQLNYYGYKKQEPASTEFPKEPVTVLPAMINLHLKRLGYSVAELAEALCWEIEEFMYRYSLDGEAPKLKIVK